MAEYNFPDSLTVVKSVGKKQQRVGIKDDKRCFHLITVLFIIANIVFFAEMTHHCGAK